MKLIMIMALITAAAFFGSYLSTPATASETEVQNFFDKFVDQQVCLTGFIDSTEVVVNRAGE